MLPSASHSFAPRATRRGFLVAALASGLASGSPSLHAAAAVPRADDERTFELDELTLTDLQAGMQSGKWTARGLAEKYLERIEAIDRRGPHLNSVIEVNPDALTLADELDKERKERGSRGPLHGIPILIKDNIDTADKMATTAGSLALVGSRPKKDAFLVTQLRGAGALILGKTNLSEWANARSTSSTSGWSGRGGLTKNPYALDRNPSGSSSGSGVAVAANLCAAAIGTETDGSILSPASTNGLVGLKPTIGLVSRSGVIPISHTQDTAGPMTRTVKDAALLLTALAGIDREDKISPSSGGQGAKDYVTFLKEDGLKGARIGVARNYFGFHPGVETVMVNALKALKDQGAILIETTELPKSDQFSSAELTVFEYEMKAGVNAYLAKLGDRAPVKTLKEVIDFNKTHATQELPYFGQELLIRMQAKGSLESYEYVEALAKCRRLSRTEGIDPVMEKHHLDAIIAPGCGPACVTDLLLGDRGAGGDIISIAAVAGYPSITVPAGHFYGLPIGLCFIGKPWSEPKLLQLAYGFEQATKARRPPRFLPTADLGRPSRG